MRETLVPDDGWFDIVAVEADGAIQSVQAVLEMMFRSNGSSKLKRVWWGRGRTVRVELIEGAPRPVQLDGEVTGATPFEARLMPGALSVLVGPAFKTHHG
jgi:diacylglycerol kinase family enzyme